MGHSRLINSALAKNCGHRNHLGPLTPPLPLAHALAASAAASSPPRRSRSAAVSRRSSIQSRRDGSRRTAESAPKRSWICDHPAREIRRSITPDASRWGNFPAGGEQGRLIGITGSPFRDRACRQHREDEGLPERRCRDPHSSQPGYEQQRSPNGSPNSASQLPSPRTIVDDIAASSGVASSSSVVIPRAAGWVAFIARSVQVTVTIVGLRWFLPGWQDKCWG